MMKKGLIAAGIVVAILVVLGGVKALQIAALIEHGENFAPPAETVSTAKVIEQTWQPTLDAVGSLSPVQGLVLRTEVPGTVEAIEFSNGADVKAGDVLARLEADSEQAQLRSAEARAAWARTNYERTKQLRAQSTISQAQLDEVETELREALSAVDNLKAIIAKKTIRAPFAGRLGIREVNVGDVLETGDAIVPLQSLDPVYVDFYLPQQSLALVQTGMVVRLHADPYPETPFEGRLTAINPSVDAVTRNFRLQATLGNEQELLRPGMFVKVSVVLPKTERLLAIPSTAVMHAPYGDSVFVVESGTNMMTGQPGLVARQQFVRLGIQRGDFVAVNQGLSGGETVVAAGAFKLQNGAPVSINNESGPRPSLEPAPEDT